MRNIYTTLVCMDKYIVLKSGISFVKTFINISIVAEYIGEHQTIDEYHALRMGHNMLILWECSILNTLIE